PSRSTLPTNRSANPSAHPDVAYRKATSGRRNPPSCSVWANMMKIATKSQPVTANCPAASMTNEARYVIVARIHIPTIQTYARSASATLHHHFPRGERGDEPARDPQRRRPGSLEPEDPEQLSP